METDLPNNSLPTYEECMQRVANRDYLVDNNLLVDDYYSDVPLPNSLHESLYEYDSIDPVPSS